MATNEAADGHPRPTSPLDTRAVMSVLAAIGMAPLVDREAESDLINARLTASAHGPGSVIVIAGIPGVGKTRVAVTTAAGLDRTVISLRCDEHMRNVPYFPFLDPAAGLGDLAALLASPLAGADSTTTRLDLFENVDRLIVQRAGDTTCVLLVDQLELIDAASIDLLRHLVRRGHSVVATMLVGTSQIDSPLGQQLTDWNHERLLLEVPLAPLGRSAADELVTHLLGPVDRDLNEAIYSRTDGHPFLLEEFVRFLVTEGYVNHRKGVWRRSDLAFPSGGEVSFGITAAILRRHDHLPLKTRQALLAASVLGAQCPLSLLAAVLECPEADLIDDLVPAIAFRIFRMENYDARNNLKWGRFALPLVRDAHYASLTREDRRALHRRAAEILAGSPAERSSGRGNSTDAALLAYHAEQGHAWDLTYEASLAAGDAAVSVLAGRDALAHFERARRLARDGLVSADVANALALDYRFVSTLRGLGRLDEAAIAAHDMALRAATAGDRAAEAWAWIQLAGARTFSYRSDDVEADLERGRVIADTLEDDGLLAEALATRGVLRSARGLLDQAEQDFQVAIPLADRLGDRAFALKGLIYVGLTASWRGQFRKAIATCEEATQLAEAAHDTAALAEARYSLALALAGGGEYERALVTLHEVLTFVKTSGEPYFAARAPNTIGWIYRELGLVEQAFFWDERASAESDHEGGICHLKARANSLLNMGSDLMLLGRLDQSEEILNQAEEAVNQSDFLSWRTANRLTLCQGELALARGDGAQALSLATDALAQSRSTQAAKHGHQAHDLAGRAHMVLRRHKDAVERLEQAVATADAIEYWAGHWRSLAHLGDALQQQGRSGEAKERFVEAGRIVDAIAMNLRNPQLRADFLAAAEVATVLTRAETGSGIEPSPIPMGLTPREVEVLRLLAAGMSDREIAESLSISERTAGNHVQHAMHKIGVDSRTEAAVFAVRHDLDGHPSPAA